MFAVSGLLLALLGIATYYLNWEISLTFFSTKYESEMKAIINKITLQ
jgi:hypothetical protein